MNALVSRTRAIIERQPYHLLLPFTCVWLIKPFYGGSRMDWLGLFIAWPSFLALYTLAHASRRAASTVGLLCLSLLGALYVPLNPEASGIFGFAAAIYAGGQPRRNLLWIYLLAINLLLLVEALLFQSQSVDVGRWRQRSCAFLRACSAERSRA